MKEELATRLVGVILDRCLAIIEGDKGPEDEPDPEWHEFWAVIHSRAEWFDVTRALVQRSGGSASPAACATAVLRHVLEKGQ